MWRGPRGRLPKHSWWLCPTALRCALDEYSKSNFRLQELRLELIFVFLSKNGELVPEDIRGMCLMTCLALVS